ncbi:MAG: hypothetical protein BalsKO_31570 [Balneolaceae bacterium]
MFFLLFSFLIFNSSCNRENVPSHIDYEILFSVNDISIDVYNFESKYVTHLINTGKNDTKTERYRFLNEYIDNLVLADASEERELLDHPTYLSALNFQKRKSMMDVFFTDEMDKIIEPPTDEEVRLAYAKKERKVYVRQLFSLREEELLEPYQRLISGENFVDVANDYFNTTEYDSLAGYLGPINYFGVDDAFAETAFSLNEGEFSKPVRSMFGFHIIYIEYIEFPAMLAEDDYQYRKTGITSQVRLRKQNITSNTYVRDLMESLLVEVDSKKILELKEAIANLNDEQIINRSAEGERESDFWNDERLDGLRTQFDSNTVFATFLFGGERLDFTFDDYLKWLPYLSFEESKERTGASIGRGLRNEVLYKLAEDENYSSDIRVQEKVKQRGYEVLSELYQYELTREALQDTSSVEVPKSFRDRLITAKQIQIVASYWKILVSTLNDAKSLKLELDSNLNSQESYESYYEIKQKVISPSESDYSLVKDALIETPMIGFSDTEGWMILYVENRTITEINDIDNSADISTRYKIFKSLDNEIVRLRENAIIKVDTLLFEEIYTLYN